MFQAIETKHGPISVLVNSAEIAIPEPFLDTTEENFRKVIDINVVGVFLATQHAARSMIANNIAGSIVNMSSINAVVAIPTIPAYCASKGAVMQLTKAASLALAPHGIRVNALGRLDRLRDDGRHQRKPRGYADRHVAHASEETGRAQGGRRRRRVPCERHGQLHNRRDDLR
jgi:NAD(P)-dependent dehydrogenase (short-subunit alcohol dehydrogenase family)